MSIASAPLPPVPADDFGGGNGGEGPPRADRPERPPEPGAPEAQARRTFFQEPAVQTLLPLATSIIFHIAIILVGFFLYKGVRAVVAEVAQEQLFVPDTTIVKDGMLGGIPNPGLNDPNRMATQDKIDVAESEGWSDRKGNLSQSLAGDSAQTADAVIAAGPNAGFGTGGLDPGAGPSGNGELAAFGPAGGGAGSGPKAPAFGVSGNAFKIAYVCDSSGSMLSKMPQLKDELTKAVGALEPVQAFNVIFFADPDVKPMALSDHLLMANPPNKVKFSDFIQRVNASGSTDPLPGLELAFAQHPQLIYLLTDGDFPDNDKVLKRIRQLDSDKSVRLNTIVFTSPKSADKGIVQLMQTLAEEFGGQWRVVAPDDLE